MSGRHEESYEFEERFSNEHAPFLGDLERQDEPRQSEDEKAIVQPQPEKKGKRATAYLDGLRGLAALCVFNNHTIGGGAHEHGFGQEGDYYFISLPFVRTFYNGGSAAVSIFFVLSGFVVTQSLLKQARDSERIAFYKSWLSAVIRRPIRLYFPCWIVAFIIAMALHLPNDIYPEVPWCKRMESIGAEIGRWSSQSINFFNPLHYHGSDQFWYPYDLVVWTIPIELKGSILVFGLVAVHSFIQFIPPIASVGMLFISEIVLLQIGLWWQACFIAGLSLAILDLHQIDMNLYSRYVKPRVVTIVLHVVWVLSYYLLSEPATAGKPEWSLATPGWHTLTSMIPEAYSKDQFFRFWQSWGAIFFVYATMRISWVQWFFNTRPLQYLGYTSFMLYLVHLPMAYCWSDRWVRVFGQIGLFSEAKWWDNLVPITNAGPVGLNPRWIVSWTTVLAFDLAVAHLFTRFIDQPCVTLGKKLAKLLRLSPPPKPTKEEVLDSESRLRR